MKNTQDIAYTLSAVMENVIEKVLSFSISNILLRRYRKAINIRLTLLLSPSVVVTLDLHWSTVGHGLTHIYLKSSTPRIFRGETNLYKLLSQNPRVLTIICLRKH